MIENMDPVMKLWMFESWIQDLTEKNEFAKNYSILVGSFSNYEMAQNMLGTGTVKTVNTSDEEFDKASNMLLNDIKESSTPRRRRKLMKS